MKAYPKNFFVIVFLFVFLVGCASSKLAERMTSYEVSPSLQLLTENSSEDILELKFKEMHSETDAQRLMFSQFGKWDDIIEIGRKYPLLVWKDVKLFKADDELYTVMAGAEKTQIDYNIPISYCSVVVYDSKGRNCFRENSPVRDSLVHYFIKGTQELEKDDSKFKIALN